MPSSPRWHRERLWVLESGRGALAVVDPVSGDLRRVATVPGFARGPDFCGPFAFVDLSKVREIHVFSGLPITREPTQRDCGVWVLDTVRAAWADESSELSTATRCATRIAK